MSVPYDACGLVEAAPPMKVEEEAGRAEVEEPDEEGGARREEVEGDGEAGDGEAGEGEATRTTSEGTAEARGVRVSGVGGRMVFAGVGGAPAVHLVVGSGSPNHTSSSPSSAS